MSKPLEILKLGAGVQSSTLALMAEIGYGGLRLDAAIFCDTQAEPEEVYTWLDWLESQLSYPLYRVTAGSLTDACLETKTAKAGHKYTRALIPAYVSGAGIFGRKCTADFKVIPGRRKARQLAGIHGKQCKELRVNSWLGITTDEIQRMKVSVEPWEYIRHPLIEEFRMSRQDCLDWMKEHGYPEPPRSACAYCPFHSNEEWRRIKTLPGEWQKVVQFEKDLQAAAQRNEGRAQMKGLPYLHNSRIPIDEVDLDAAELSEDQMDWLDECAGMCGV